MFDLLLRKYLSLRENIAAGVSREPSELEVEAGSLEVSGIEHAVMAAIVVLADKLGPRLFGSGLQVLSCIRLVLEHEVPGGQGEDTGSGNVRAGGGSSDAASRIARVEADEAGTDRSNVNEGDEGVGFALPVSGGADADAGAGETLCSVVLGLLTTLLELGEDSRPAEEEQELRSMIRPLKVRLGLNRQSRLQPFCRSFHAIQEISCEPLIPTLNSFMVVWNSHQPEQVLAAGHHSTEVREMSAMLCATIMSRELTPEQRRQERARLNVAVDGKRAEKSHRDRMLEALDAAEEDLQNESPPLRARGVVTLTRCGVLTVV